MLEHLGCDPIEGMAQIAMDISNPVEIRARMYAELAQYIAPKRKSIEVGGGDANRVVFNIGIDRRPSSQAITPISQPLTIGT